MFHYGTYLLEISQKGPGVVQVTTDTVYNYVEAASVMCVHVAVAQIDMSERPCSVEHQIAFRRQLKTTICDFQLLDLSVKQHSA